MTYKVSFLVVRKILRYLHFVGGFLALTISVLTIRELLMTLVLGSMVYRGSVVADVGQVVKPASFL